MKKPLTIPREAELQQAEDLVRSDPQHALQLLIKLNSEKDLTPLDEARIKLLIARAHLYTGRFDQGEQFALEALVVCEKNTLHRYIGLAHNECGVFRFVNSDFASALEQYALAEEIIKLYGADIDLGKVYLNMGNVYHRSGQDLRAIEMYERVVKVAELTNDLLTQAKVATNLIGLFGEILFDREQAIAYARRAIELFTQLNDSVGLAKALGNLATQYVGTGEYELAIEYFNNAIMIRKDHTEPMDLFTNYQGLVKALIRVGNVSAAREACNRCLAHEHARLVSPGITSLLEAEVDLLVREGKYAEALTLIDKIFEHKNDPLVLEYQPVLMEHKARALRGLGQVGQALDILTQLLIEREEQTRLKLQRRIYELKMHFDSMQSNSQAELERVRNVELADALQESRALQVRNEEYVAFIAHELKSPLTTIRSIANLMRGSAPLSNDERIAYSREVFDISTRMFDLIRKVLDGSSGAAQKRTNVDVCTIWSHVIGMWKYRAEEKSILLTYIHPDEPVLIAAQEAGIVSILDNLVSNAIKFSSEGSQVNVSVRTVPTTEDSTSVLLSVQDTGPGLSARDLSLMFTPFGTLSAQPTQGEDSTGLGLVIVKREVESAGGRIWCESVVGQGATFFVELPMKIVDEAVGRADVTKRL